MNSPPFDTEDFEREARAADFRGDCERNGDFEGFHDYRGDTFTFYWAATAPGCDKIEIVNLADDRGDSEARARETVADMLGVRAEFVVLHLRRQEPNF